MSPEELTTPTRFESGILSASKPPILAALFLIKFDLKVGYTIAWKRAIADTPLEGIVEFKSLPSGLHNVEEDLVYFSYDDFAGISAFKKGKASERERNANFVAVGALVKLKDGRLGRAWEHSSDLKRLASQSISEPENYNGLLAYWDEHGTRSQENDQFESPQLSPFTLAQRKSRALSTLTLGLDEKKTLPTEHPALAIIHFIDAFGPLIYPLHRLSLLRKRILLVTSAPIRRACEYVYLLSILSSVPKSLASSILLPTPTLVRLRPLFSVGIHDIPFLEKLAEENKPACSSNSTQDTDNDINNTASEDKPSPSGWLACTTDEILVMKPDLYDIVIEMSSSHVANQVSPRKRPIIKVSGTQNEIKASQRDWRRYKNLRRVLNPLRKALMASTNDTFDDDHREVDEEEDLSNSTDTSPLLLRSLANINDDDEDGDEQDERDSVDPTTWAELAYQSFMWWASAGEKDTGTRDEESKNNINLGDLSSIVKERTERIQYKDEDISIHSNDDERAENDRNYNRADAQLEMEIISHFHRITTNLFEGCSEVVDNSDSEDEENQNYSSFDSESLRSMGLDVWNSTDRQFVKEFVDIWYDKEVYIEGENIEWCGVRIC